MNLEEKYYRVSNLLRNRYLGQADIRVERDDYSFDTMASSYQIGGVVRYELSVSFEDKANFEAFLDDTLQNKTEQDLRDGNPTLKKAWEEYQILLRLYK